MFDDVVCYLIFYQIEDFSELYLDTYIRLNDTIGDWWSANNFSSVLTNSTNLGQCYLPAVFSINKIQETPPIFKFVYNRNLYHTFWDPLQIHISDMDTYLSNKFKTTEVDKLAPIARFCFFNNSSLRNYLARYITCTTDKCVTDLSYMKEPDRCGALKLKYQELMTRRMRFKCLYKEATQSTIPPSMPTPMTTSMPTPTQNIERFELGLDSQPSEEDLQDEFTVEENKTLKEQEIKINQMFGFRNVLLLNLIEYAIKYHKCQTDNINIADCQDLPDKIDTNDQKDDLNLNEIIVDRQSDLFNEYDSLLDDYNKILKSQEAKKLEPLNILANLDQKNKNKNNVDIFNKSADDFYSIFNDLTNLGDRTALKYKDTTVESFDNQLNDNMDLTENTFQKYKNRIQSHIKGINNPTNVGYLIQVKNMFYELVDILTKDGRIMTSGMFILIISLSLYFIDISS
jgi:hypothetical protein